MPPAEVVTLGALPPAPLPEGLESARLPNGMAIAPTALGDHPEALLRIDGVEATLRTHIDHGSIIRTVDGFRLAEPTKPAPVPEAPKVDHGPALDRGASEALDVLRNHGGGMEFAAAISDFLKTGEIQEGTLHSLTSNLGTTLKPANGYSVEPEDVKELISKVAEKMGDQAVAALADVVPDGSAALEWAKKNKPEEFARAYHEHLDTKSATAYRSLGVDYLAQLDRLDPQAISLPAAVPTRRLPDGRLLLTLDGMEMTWEAAVRNNLIRKTK